MYRQRNVRALFSSICLAPKPEHIFHIRFETNHSPTKEESKVPLFQRTWSSERSFNCQNAVFHVHRSDNHNKATRRIAFGTKLLCSYCEVGIAMGLPKRLIHFETTSLTGEGVTLSLARLMTWRMVLKKRLIGGPRWRNPHYSSSPQ